MSTDHTDPERDCDCQKRKFATRPLREDLCKHLQDLPKALERITEDSNPAAESTIRQVTPQAATSEISLEALLELATRHRVRITIDPV